MKNTFPPRAVVLAVLLGLAPVLFSHPAMAQTFRTTDEAEQVVRFFADHTLGEVDGTLRPVVGSLTFDPATPADGLSGRFTADVASFDTGLGLRDRDMRKKYLETETYPDAVFTLDDARPTLLDGSADDSLRLAVTGSMTLHGVTRPHVVQATLTPSPQGYRVHAAFPLRLTDYDIKPPRQFLLKVQDDIRVEVILHLVREP